jgi:hypothetical protein
MKYLFILSSLLILHGNFFAQNCSEINIDKIHNERIESDSIYKEDVQLRIKYYVKLSKIILPKYFELKKNIYDDLESNDKIKIRKLAKRYEQNRLGYLNRFKETQLRVYQNINAYSSLNNLLIFETFNLFPDSYALLLNESIHDSYVDSQDEVLVNELYSKYEYIVENNFECITEMMIDIKSVKKEYKIVEIFQNTGNKTKKLCDKSDLINLLLWVSN